ncbi:Long-chain-fatty-acid--CoA ligase [Rubripirellula amarantea]|uniref:Long-chain-fatty-acid--CoA ligase n=1 Tax=Rubripirellula amarantea TaxID=2527999 RepID=A0A5C5WGJ9_9BACT|nr:AMP-binding protein [Rubripirellula amarantea]TWT49667.1 Long-chain-fatty-acid--CoA ligase [Rubripirellula amarantea]
MGFLPLDSPGRDAQPDYNPSKDFPGTLDSLSSSTLPVTHTDDHGQATPRGISTYRGLAAFELLTHAANQVPDRTAIVQGDQAWTYGQLEQLSQQAAAMLTRKGIQPGDRVGILLPNTAEYIIAVNAIWRCEAVAVAISPLMVSSEIESLLKHTDCHWVICLDVLASTITCPSVKLLLVSIREQLSTVNQLGYLWMRRQSIGAWTLVGDERHHGFWRETHATSDAAPQVSFDPAKTPAYILPTGGTTGAAKSVTLTHENMVANAWQQYMWTGQSFGVETMLAVLPFFHSYGMSAIVMAGTAMAATLVSHHRYNTHKTIELLNQFEPTVFHAVPAMLVAMNEKFRSHPLHSRSLKWVISGGASLDAAVADEFAQHSGALVVEGYGLSEASPVTHVGDLFGPPHYGTIGYPLPETACKIASPTHLDQAVAPGSIGELLIRGPQVMQGYWNDQDSTEKAFHNGWLCTGDLAVQHDDGTYEIVGRKKNLIITSGFNVYPSEVEAVLRSAPGVADAAVIGISDDKRGEVVKAFIVATTKAKWDESAVRSWCHDRLSKHKQPRVYELVTGDLPRNFLGKVIHRSLREDSRHDPGVQHPGKDGSADSPVDIPDSKNEVAS